MPTYYPVAGVSFKISEDDNNKREFYAYLCSQGGNWLTWCQPWLFYSQTWNSHVHSTLQVNTPSSPCPTHSADTKSGCQLPVWYNWMCTKWFKGFKGLSNVRGNCNTFNNSKLLIQELWSHDYLPIQRFEGTEWSESTKCRYWPREARYVLPEDRCWKEVGLVHLLTSTFVVCGTNTVEVTNLEGRVFCIQYCSLVSWPACTCLPARNDLVNKVKFLGLISQNQWDCEIANYYVALPLQHYSFSFEYPFFYWAGFPHNILNIARLHCR